MVVTSVAEGVHYWCRWCESILDLHLTVEMQVATIASLIPPEVAEFAKIGLDVALEIGQYMPFVQPVSILFHHPQCVLSETEPKF
jgi:hypothetical protein